MRGQHLLVGSLALLLGACSGGGGHAPPPLNKQLLVGKWKNASSAKFLAGYEFTDDGTAKLTFQGMEQPVLARYAWSGDRTLDLDYQLTPEVQRAYKAAAKAYKDQITDLIKAGKLHERAGGPMSAAVHDELPARETLQVAISEQPRFIMLTDEGATTQTFDKAE
jgi:hypothetical protein